jgi:hypothetical protein
MALVFAHFRQGDVMLLAVGEDVVIGGREGEGGTGAQSQQRDQSREVLGLDIVVDRV